MIITVPSIISAKIEPNPSDINSEISIYIVADEKEIYLKEEERYSGTFYAGEE